MSSPILWGGCAEYGHFSRYSCQNQYYRSETFPQLREEVQNGSKRAFDQANLDHPEWEEFGWWESMTIFPAARKNPMHPSFMRWYAD